MSGAVLLTVILWLAVLAFAGAAWWFLSEDELSGWGLICGGLAILAAIVAIIFPTVTFVGRAVGETTCRNWGAQVGARTKFVILNWADTGTCLARTPSGRWVLNTNWLAFVKAEK